MIRECFRAKTGIMFTTTDLENLGLNPSHLYPTVLDRPDAVDSLEAKRVPIRTIHWHWTHKLPLPTFVTSLLERGLTGPENTCEERSHLLGGHSRTSTDATVWEDEHKPEELHDLHDALSPIYDQLALKWWFWMALELLPIRNKYRFENPITNELEDKVGLKPNLGGPRHIPRQRKGKVLVHRSVKTRMDALGYKPRASFQKAVDNNNVIWEA
jgi:hypothetical protein